MGESALKQVESKGTVGRQKENAAGRLSISRLVAEREAVDVLPLSGGPKARPVQRSNLLT